MSEAIKLIFKSFQRVSGAIYGDNKENLKRAEYELTELERLADMGRATEKVLEKGVILTNPNNYADEYCIGSGSLIESVEELLEWAKDK